MAYLLTCQSSGILSIDVIDNAVADAACCFVAMAAVVEAYRRPYRRCSMWVKSWILKRHACRTCNKLFSDLLNTDQMSFRMDLPALRSNCRVWSLW